MAGKIFVNYRRGDARDSAARLRDKLAAILGGDDVFMDVDNLRPGERFDLKLREALAETEVFLAVIGPRWNELFKARMESGEHDFVREEIAAALAAGIPIIPVPMDGAPLPKAAELPEDIRDFLLYQKHGVAYETFGRDAQVLSAEIEARRRERAQKAAEAARAAQEAARLTREREAAEAARLAKEKRQAEAEAGRRAKALEHAGNGDGKGSRWQYLAGLAAALAVLAAANQAYRWLNPPAPDLAPHPALTQPIGSALPKPAPAPVVSPQPDERCDGLLIAVANGPKPCIKPGSGKHFKDCPDCPEMVPVPAGEFLMGSPEDEKGRDSDEGPQHKVAIRKPFAVGRTHVTRDQFAKFVKATGHKTDGGCFGWSGSEWKDDKNASWQSPGFDQAGDHPVVCVNWRDATAYVDWLAKTTGQPYRLLAEAEAEYAARGVTKAAPQPRYFFGDAERDLCAYANVADETAKAKFSNWTAVPCRDGYVFTAPVMSFKPNAFGLYDVHGNAWTWTQDCWNEDYGNGPSDEGARTAIGDCSRRVLRGGSCYYYPQNLRAASRDGSSAGGRGYGIGFRAARTLN